MSSHLTEEANVAVQQGERQVVALHVANEVYGVDIAIIHTVITPQAITHVPKTPKYIKGVMNLRGRIIPVIDMRTRFDLPSLSAEEEKDMRIVIVELEGLTAGLIVDSVSEVLRLPESVIAPPSSLISTVDVDYLTGIGRIPREDAKGEKKDQLLLLLDVYKVLTLDGKEGAEKIKKLQKAA